VKERKRGKEGKKIKRWGKTKRAVLEPTEYLVKMFGAFSFLTYSNGVWNISC